MATASGKSVSGSTAFARTVVLVALIPLASSSACRRAVQETAVPEKPAMRVGQSGHPEGALPDRITNQFGMTFCRVEVNPEQWFHLPTYPSRTYYLQETELRFEHHQRFRKAAFGDGKYETIDWYYNSGYPSEWRQVFRYGQALSKFDTQYDYRLPTLREWRFACKDGYDQICPDREETYAPAELSDRSPNKFGILGLNNGNVECGDIPGLFFGTHDRAGPNAPPPDCVCDWWAKGHPDADDGLNELIVPRFVLVFQE